MKILYICSENITNPSCGCAQRSRFLYDALMRVGNVDAVKLKPEWIDESLIAKIFRKLTKVARWPFGRPCVDLCRHLVSSLEQYDIVVCRYVRSAAITQAWRIAPCYIDIDDMPIEAFVSVDSKRLPRLLRPLGFLLVSWWQKVCLKKCAGAWTVSDAQAEWVRKFGVGKVCVLPNLARRPSVSYNVNHAQERLLMTVGLMGYGPNQEGVGWFLSNIWPKVHDRWPDLMYVIAGGELPTVMEEKWAAMPGVRVLGFVDDLDALYAKSLVVVTPILSGAGTCIKVVEAGLHGRIVLATPKAIRGQEKLMAFGGVKMFENAEQFCSDLESCLKQDLAVLQRNVADDTDRFNSIESFNASVAEVVQ